LKAEIASTKRKELRMKLEQTLEFIPSMSKAMMLMSTTLVKIVLLNKMLA
jgi:hypothetical protein